MACQSPFSMDIDRHKVGKELGLWMVCFLLQRADIVWTSSIIEAPIYGCVFHSSLTRIIVCNLSSSLNIRSQTKQCESTPATVSS